jgi:hypothetical protein
MKFRNLTIATLLAGLFSSNTAFANEDINIRPFAGDFHGNGLEVAIPLFIETDNNQDGYTDSVTIQYNVYTAGTSTLVHRTPPRTFQTPTIPAGCTPNGPNYFEDDDFLSFRRRQAALNSSGTLVAASNRIHTAMMWELDCFDGLNAQFKSVVFVYSADVSGTGPVWIKTFTDKELFGMQGIDTDANLIPDSLAVVLSKEVSAGENAQVLVFNGNTGAQTITPKFYPFFR